MLKSAYDTRLARIEQQQTPSSLPDHAAKARDRMCANTRAVSPTLMLSRMSQEDVNVHAHCAGTG